MWIDVGPLNAFPTGRCTAVGDGAAVVVRTDDSVVAFANQCLHQDSPLDGGWVRDGVLSCPLHFWRFDLDGSLVGGGSDDRLDRYPVLIDNGRVSLDIPAPPDKRPIREQLLARARSYDREATYKENHDETAL